MKIDVVTTDKVVYSGDVDIVIAPATDGQLGILPRHASLLTSIKSGVILVRNSSGEKEIPVGDGFMEVNDDQVTVLV
jgi:F-type H+-transporting ATPase subunit epsilon